MDTLPALLDQLKAQCQELREQKWPRKFHQGIHDLLKKYGLALDAVLRSPKDVATVLRVHDSDLRGTKEGTWLCFLLELSRLGKTQGQLTRYRRQLDTYEKALRCVDIPNVPAPIAHEFIVAQVQLTEKSKGGPGPCISLAQMMKELQEIHQTFHAIHSLMRQNDELLKHEDAHIVFPFRAMMTMGGDEQDGSDAMDLSA